MIEFIISMIKDFFAILYLKCLTQSMNVFFESAIFEITSAKVMMLLLFQSRFIKIVFFYIFVKEFFSTFSNIDSFFLPN